MAAGISAAVTCGFNGNPFVSSLGRRPVPGDCVVLFAPFPARRRLRSHSIVSVLQHWRRRRPAAAVCFVVGESHGSEIKEAEDIESSDAAEEEEERRILLDWTAEKIARKRLEQRTYLAAGEKMNSIRWVFSSAHLHFFVFFV